MMKSHYTAIMNRLFMSVFDAGPKESGNGLRTLHLCFSDPCCDNAFIAYMYFTIVILVLVNLVVE